MTDNISASRSPSCDPPSYEQSLHHQRIERAVYDALDSQRSNRYNPGSDYTSSYLQPLGSAPGTQDGSAHGVRNVPRDDGDTDSQTSEMLAREVSCTNESLPPIHACLAVTCLILNICAPGTGTILAALAIVCCSKNDVEPENRRDVYVNVCYTFLIGIAQMLLVPVLLFGWIWSITWGMALVRLSFEKRRRAKRGNNSSVRSSTEHTSSPARNQSFSTPHYIGLSGAGDTSRAVSSTPSRRGVTAGATVAETHRPPVPPSYEIAVLALPDVGS